MDTANRSWLSGAHFAFNHDMCSLVRTLYQTGCTEADAARILVEPFVGSRIDVLDMNILSTATHVVRTRHNRIVAPADCSGHGHERRQSNQKKLIRIARHYAEGPDDLLDIAIKHGHKHGMKVLGCLRLNHNVAGNSLADVPGRNFMAAHSDFERKDFRDETFHTYLLEVYEDLLDKGVDGITLDFVRKTPFFPDEAPPEERFAACRAFLERVRALTTLPVIARVSHRAEDGAPDGQDPEGWLRAGLVDVVAPAVHDHDPETLDWPITRFVQAAREAPRPVCVWPQIWPTPRPWRERRHELHAPEALERRIVELLHAGADGAYFFNFCCSTDTAIDARETPPLFQEEPDAFIFPRYQSLFKRMASSGEALGS